MMRNGLPAYQEHVVIRVLETALKFVTHVARHRRNDALSITECGFEFSRVTGANLETGDFKDHVWLLVGLNGNRLAGTRGGLIRGADISTRK